MPVPDAGRAPYPGGSSWKRSRACVMSFARSRKFCAISSAMSACFGVPALSNDPDTAALHTSPPGTALWNAAGRLRLQPNCEAARQVQFPEQKRGDANHVGRPSNPPLGLWWLPWLKRGDRFCGGMTITPLGWPTQISSAFPQPHTSPPPPRRQVDRGLRRTQVLGTNWAGTDRGRHRGPGAPSAPARRRIGRRLAADTIMRQPCPKPEAKRPS